MQIVKSTHSLEVSKAIIENLPVGLQKYALAKQAPMVSQMPKNEACKLIDKLLLKIIFDLGWNQKISEVEIKEDDRIITGSDCFDLIKDKYVALTTEELKLAFLNGTLGNYGPFYGLGLKTLSDWLKGYSNDELKKKAMSEWNKAIDHVSIKKKTPEQKEAIILHGCLHAFADYSDNKLVVPVDHLCGVFYTYLKEKGLISLSNEKRIELYDKAKHEYENNLKPYAGKIDKDIYGSLLKSMTAKKDEAQNRSFGNMCKRYALLEYFDNLIEMNINLETILTQ